MHGFKVSRHRCFTSTVYRLLTGLGRDTLPTGVVSIRQSLEVMPTMLPHRPRVADRSAWFNAQASVKNKAVHFLRQRRASKNNLQFFFCGENEAWRLCFASFLLFSGKLFLPNQPQHAAQNADAAQQADNIQNDFQRFHVFASLLSKRLTPCGICVILFPNPCRMFVPSGLDSVFFS